MACLTLYAFLYPPFSTNLAELEQKLSAAAFREVKYGKVLETTGWFSTCSHGNPHVGIQLPRDVSTASY